MESFYRAFLTPQAKILGKKLKPYCFGHQVLLKALESPFLTGARDIEPHDLILALKVCQSSHPFQPSLELSFKDKLQLIYMSRNPASLFTECMKFQSHLNEHTKCPEYWQDTNGNSKSISAPDELFYVSNLIKSGLSYKAAWELSIGEATWLNAALFEIAGCDTQYSDPIDDTLNPPDTSALTDEEIYKQAVIDKGVERAKEFMRLRKENGC